MTLREYKQLSNAALLERFGVLLSQSRDNLAELLVCMGEVESRRAHEAAGYSSMHAYCVDRFHMSDDEAFKRIRAARLSGRFPGILAGIADGQLHLTAVTLLSRHITHANVSDLIEAAAHRTKLQIQTLIATRFPQPDVPTSLRELKAKLIGLAMPPVPAHTSESLASTTNVSTVQRSLVPEPVGPPTDERRIALPDERYPVVTPLAPSRFELRCTISQEAHDAIGAAKEFLGHAMPGADAAQIVEKALLELVARLKKQKFALAEKPREQKSEPTGRHIPAQVRREVSERDGGRCAFIGDGGHRCESGMRLELDHIRPVSCGGKSTSANLRLQCRTHNQYEAARLFGGEFMAGKRAARSHDRGPSA